MYRVQSVRSILICGGIAAAISSGACNRTEPAPADEVQTQSAQPGNQPVTVSGCLKAGEAEDTYVLTTARSEGAGDTATYQLVGGRTDGLQAHVGHRVEVSGTMGMQQELASQSTRQPVSGEDKPTGTTGTPTVQTRTEVDVKRLSVNSVKPLDDKCDM